MYKVFDDQIKRKDGECNDEDVLISKEEAKFLKREVGYLTKKIESLMNYNQELMTQVKLISI